MHFCHQPELRDFCTFLRVLKLFCWCIFNTGLGLKKFLKYTFCVFYNFLGDFKNAYFIEDMNIYPGLQKSLPLRTGHAAHASGNGKILNAHCVRTLRMHFCHQPELRDFCTFLRVFTFFAGAFLTLVWVLKSF